MLTVLLRLLSLCVCDLPTLGSDSRLNITPYSSSIAVDNDKVIVTVMISDDRHIHPLLLLSLLPE